MKKNDIKKAIDMINKVWHPSEYSNEVDNELHLDSNELNKACELAVLALQKQMQFSNDEQYEVFKSVLNERHRQDSKWGEQNHPPGLWTGILGEEYGEFCEAVNETVFDNGTDKGGYENMKKEAIHVAAVAIGFIEYLERNKKSFWR